MNTAVLVVVETAADSSSSAWGEALPASQSMPHRDSTQMCSASARICDLQVVETSRDYKKWEIKVFKIRSFFNPFLFKLFTSYVKSDSARNKKAMILGFTKLLSVAFA